MNQKVQIVKNLGYEKKSKSTKSLCFSKRQKVKKFKKSRFQDMTKSQKVQKVQFLVKDKKSKSTKS